MRSWLGEWPTKRIQQQRSATTDHECGFALLVPPFFLLGTARFVYGHYSEKRGFYTNEFHTEKGQNGFVLKRISTSETTVFRMSDENAGVSAVIGAAVEAARKEAFPPWIGKHS
ncbi:hypothetical protein P9726_06185 [Geobacillus stearothermophilus]|uniref:hypothetical protein n=1 Tax=Geobacillus stearothermophilus TaxID=1422 RepID=UPI002E21DD81|nr:hypothetical protein [Geobacillus stearothermophilus]